MDNNQDSKVETITPNYSENVFPYASLITTPVSEQIQKQITEFFHLEILETKNSDFHVWVCQNREPGQHKVQTLRLLAAALCLQNGLQDIQMTLQNDIEFFDLDPLRKAPRYALEISEAVRLYLDQAGLTWPTQENFLNSEQVEELRQNYLSLAEVMKIAQGA